MGCLLKANGLYSRMTVGAVLLAGGAGRRLGGRPQALLELGGVPLVMRQLIALSGAGVDEVAVVLGHHADAVEAAIASLPITLVRQPRPDDGAAAAERLGLQALSPALDAIIVAPATLPLIGTEDIVALIAAYRRRGTARWVVPRVPSSPAAPAEPGEPVIFDAALRQQWAAAGRERPDFAHAQTHDTHTDTQVDTQVGTHATWRAAHADQVHWLDTDNRRYRLRIDTPEDLESFAAMSGHRLRWPAAFAAPQAEVQR